MGGQRKQVSFTLLGGATAALSPEGSNSGGGGGGGLGFIVCLFCGTVLFTWFTWFNLEQTTQVANGLATLKCSAAS